MRTKARGVMDYINKAFSPEPVVVDANLFERELSALDTQNTDSPLQSTKHDFTIRDLGLPSRDLSRLSALLKVKYLKTLSLTGTQILPSGAQEIANGLKMNKFVEVLDLSDNPLGDQGVDALVNVVKYKSTIKEVYLRNTSFTSDGCASLREMLKVNKSIRVLDLSGNVLGDEGAKLICQGVLDSPLGDMSDLKKLFLRNCEIGDAGCSLFQPLLSKTRGIKEVDLSGNKIGPASGKFISNGLIQVALAAPVPIMNPNQDEETTEADATRGFVLEGLEILNLSDNYLGNKGVIDLAKRLPANGTIKKLYLQNVGMKNEALVTLCTNVVDAGCVVDLHIGENQLSKKETEKVDGNAYFSVVTPIITMLGSNIDMNMLDLSRVELSPEDVKLLGDFLGENIQCRLKCLNLSGCNINDDGATVLANGLKFNMGLKSLNVSSNAFGPRGAHSFAKVFKRAKNLEEFFITGQSRIQAEGENYLAECLKYNKTIVIKGASKELDYLNEFVRNGKAFERNEKGELVAWSQDAWSVVKRGCGQVIGTVIYNLSKAEFQQFKKNVLLKSRNVVNQNMFEYVLRHAEAPASDVVSIFMHKCRISLDDNCSSKASVSMAKEKEKSDDVTYRFVAKDCSKDPMVRELAKNNQLFLGRYLTENGPAIYETHELKRVFAKDTLNSKEEVVVQIYENDLDFMREKEAREDIQSLLKAAGPFAIYDTILREKEVHDETNVISFNSSITDLRNSISNHGVTAGYDINKTVFLAKRAAQCLGTINNLGRIHGDFKPRNFLMVAKERWGDDPLGRTSKKKKLPEKWVLFDLSKSVPHNTGVSLRMDSSYLPPEVARVSFNANYQDKALPLANEKMDVWSFGVVLYQLLTGVHLFHVEANTDRIYKKKERLELMNWINLDSNRQRLVLHRANEAQFENESTYKKIKEASIDLLNWCLQGDPHNRPTFNQILSHPFFIYKTHVSYTNVDLLLGWYQSIGTDKRVATHKNNRTHAHVINSSPAECKDVLQSLEYYFAQAGCKLTDDSEDGKRDINIRRDMVQKARCLIVLLTKDCMWNPKVVQKLLWAVDSLETTTLILLDVSTAGTSALKFDFDSYFKEVSDEKKLDELIEFMMPVPERLNVEHINLHEHHTMLRGEVNDLTGDGGASWLKKYIRKDIVDLLANLQPKVIPYRSRPFQTQAMVNEILVRSGFFPESHLLAFTLQNNNKELGTYSESDSNATKQNKLKILILYNAEMEVQNPKLRNDAMKLRSKVMLLENAEYKSEVFVVGNQNEVYKHFKRQERDANKLIATDLTLVLCMVDYGFYENFRDAILLLNSAEGPLSIVPLRYGNYNLKDKNVQSEILNLGIENTGVLKKLKDDRFYIPLPSTTPNLEYETTAALNFIVKEAGRNVEVVKKNETKDNSDIYVRYENTNFFNRTIY